MDRPTQQQQRDVNNNQFGDHVAIHQGDTHNFANAAIHRGDVHNVTIHLPHQPARAAPRVIPYPPNEDFVYRPGLVDMLDALLPSTSQFSSAALWGLGGSGKTQIALQYAYRRCNNRACSVFWVHADNEATFTHDYKLIGKKLGVDGTLDGENFLAAVRDGIEGQEPWVLVLDNADDLALFGVGSTTRRLLDFVPTGQTRTGTVLWTSRDGRIAGTLVRRGCGIQVACMMPSEARELLATARNDRTEDPAANTLLDELQCLPLAISQAGAYIRRTDTPLPEYLSLLARGKRRWYILNESEFDRHRKPDVPNSILETWGISIGRIRKESEMAYRILHVIAYMDNQDIPQEVVVAASRPDIAKGTGELEDLRVTRAMTRLKEFSFVSRRSTEDDSRSYQMHKLVQEALRYGLSVRKSPREAEGSHGGNCPDQQDGEEFFSGVALDVITDLFPFSRPETWAKCEKYVRHAMRVGEWSEMSGRVVDTAELLHKVAEFLWERERWRENEAVIMKVMKLLRENFGENDPDTMVSMEDLSRTYSAQSRHSEAEEIATKVLALRRDALGERHADTITTRSVLAELYTKQGRHTEAEEIATTALVQLRERFGEKHPNTIRGMETLAKAYQGQGRYNESEGIQIKALSFWTEAYGEKDPNTLESMLCLSVTYSCQARYDEVEDLMAKILERQREVFGEKHPYTLLSMSRLAAVLQMRGRHKDALSLMEDCVRQQRSILGQNHPPTERSTRYLEYLRNRTPKGRT